MSRGASRAAGVGPHGPPRVGDRVARNSLDDLHSAQCLGHDEAKCAGVVLLVVTHRLQKVWDRSRLARGGCWETGGKPDCREKRFDAPHVGHGQLVTGRGEVGRGAEANRHGFAMIQTQFGNRLDGMSEGVSQVQEGSLTEFSRIFADDPSLDCDASPQKFDQGRRVESGDGLMVLLDELQECRIGDHGVLDTLGQTGAEFARRKRAQRGRIGEDRSGLPEGPDHVLEERSPTGTACSDLAPLGPEVHRRLAADRGVDHRQERGRGLNERDSAHPCRRREAGNIADQTSAESNDQPRAIQAILGEELIEAFHRRQCLQRLVGGDCDGIDGQLGASQSLEEHRRVGRHHVLVGHHDDAWGVELGGDRLGGAAQQTVGKEHLVGLPGNADGYRDHPPQRTNWPADCGEAARAKARQRMAGVRLLLFEAPPVGTRNSHFRPFPLQPANDVPDESIVDPPSIRLALEFRLMSSLNVLALASALTIAAPASVALAAVAPAVAADEAIAEGSVKSVDAKAGTFVLTTAGKDITVRTSKDTTYASGGKESTLEEVVKVGERVKVTHKDALATKVETAPSKKPKTPEKKPEKKVDKKLDTKVDAATGTAEA